MNTPTHEWIPRDPQDLDRLLVIDILMKHMAASLREREKDSRAAFEIEQAINTWRATVEYWTYISHYGGYVKSL